MMTFPLVCNAVLCAFIAWQAWRHPRRLAALYKEIAELRIANDALRVALQEARTELAYAEKNRR